MLLKFGFDKRWVRLVIECLTSTSFSILINGVAHGYFYPSSGIRQGDTLSPYIFILCMEPLIRHLNLLAINSKNHVGILSSPRGFRVSNLVFTDDCLLFAKVTTKGARNILQAFNLFAKASGQQINFHKSSLFFSDNTSSQLRNSIVNILQIQHKITIGKYLGIHNIVFWKDSVNEQELIKRVKQKLAGWKTKSLSKAGKLTLIKSNLLGMSNHLMFYFNCPSRVTKRLNKECRNFFWGSERNFVPLAWNKICRPKNLLGQIGLESAYK